MSKSIPNELNSTFYVRSKISYYPLSHSIKPVPEGLSVVVFSDQESIDKYFSIRGIVNKEEFDILPVGSIYDFMKEVSELGYIGIWHFPVRPIMFGNYYSDIDIDLPTFLFTLDGCFIGASGEVDKPNGYREWRNYYRTDKILQRFVKFKSGSPIPENSKLFTFVTKEDDSPCILLNIKSSILGPYSVSPGALAVFTDLDCAEYVKSSFELTTELKIMEIDIISSLITEMHDIDPTINILLNPYRERYRQGYFLEMDKEIILRTVHGTYLLDTESNSFVETHIPLNIDDTVVRPNSLNPIFRGIKSTLPFPLKNHLYSTKSSVSRREAKELIKKIVENSQSDCSQKVYGPESLFSGETFLVYAFDKIMSSEISNLESGQKPLIFFDVIEFVQFLFHKVFPLEYDLRLNGYFCCGQGKYLPGTENEKREAEILKDHQMALEDFLEMIFTDGYKVEHSELIKSFVNTSSLSMEIELCGYLGDIAVYHSELVKDKNLYCSEFGINEDDLVNQRLHKLMNRYIARNSSIKLDQRIQNKLRIYLGAAYENLSIESKCILESSLIQYLSLEQFHNHDYAGLTMKLCKVFEREMNNLILVPWSKEFKSKNSKEKLKEILSSIDENDQTRKKLLGWLLNRSKLELGSMRFIFLKVAQQNRDDLYQSIHDYVTSLGNADFLLSEHFIETLKLITERYRNGGVHEKIVNFDICQEAFDYMLFNENSALKKLLSK